MRQIELLAPAKNIECGKAAILHGADAVYIGAQKFGARAAAGNSIQDLKELVDFAHAYYAKVYVALNTILTQEELQEAQSLIKRLYEIGVDALIIQDMGILELDIPPIPIHASTQTDNRTIEKVKFFEQKGFEQVVLARELSLEQIRNICQNTTAKIECFVHGALCVSYSGQCYMSEAIMNRSANRGECAQICRLPFSLTDSDGTVIVKDSHLLSLKDLNLSARLEELIDAGVSSFKIEGRLKDIDYVKNITSHYRKCLDDILLKNKDLKRSSSGVCHFMFESDPFKSFNRGFTNYFIDGRKTSVINTKTPKSMGEEIGKVTKIMGNLFSIDTNKTINNGDGLCFISKNNELLGFNVNEVQANNWIKPNAILSELTYGLTIFRNYNHQFNKQLQGSVAERKIAVSFKIEETVKGLSVELIDEDANVVSQEFNIEKEVAKNAELALLNINKQFSKLGGTIYSLENISLNIQTPFFITASMLNEMRRVMVESLEKERNSNYKRNVRAESESNVIFPTVKLDYRANINNKKASEFYKKHGVTEQEPSFEHLRPEEKVVLMHTKHCIKYSLGLCPIHQQCKQKYAEPLFLSTNIKRFELAFDCKNCEMKVLG